MADQGRKLEQKLQALTFDVRALLHLAVWGSAAALALMIAVLSAYLTLRPQRPAIVLADPSPVQHGRPQASANAAQLAARAAEAETEMRRLSEVVLALGSDRDQLAARVGSLERSLEDVTGALHRRAAMPPATEPAASAAVSATLATPPAVLPVPLPRPQAAPPTEAVAMSVAQPTAAEAPPPDPAAAAARTASVPARETLDPEPAGAGEFGVDIGSATKFDGLRALWHSTKGANPALFEGLHPIVAVRESRSRGVELRLIAGPLAGTEAATRLCAALMAARRYCQMTTFEGQPLALSAPEPERRPAPARPRDPPAATSNSAATGSTAAATANSATATGSPAPSATGTAARSQARPRP